MSNYTKPLPRNGARVRFLANLWPDRDIRENGIDGYFKDGLFYSHDGADNWKPSEIKQWRVSPQPATTTAPAPMPEQAGPSDEEIQSIWDAACQDGPGNPGWNRHIRFARALLARHAAQPDASVEPIGYITTAEIEEFRRHVETRRGNIYAVRLAPWEHSNLPHTAIYAAPVAAQDDPATMTLSDAKKILGIPSVHSALTLLSGERIVGSPKAIREVQALAQLATQVSAQDASEDPLQSAANWLVNDCGYAAINVAGALRIGFNRAQRLSDAARAAKGGEQS